MRKQIDNLFKDIEEKPLFYIESGSRLWGIESPDSDFDVRGFGGYRALPLPRAPAAPCCPPLPPPPAPSHPPPSPLAWLG